MKSFIFFLTVAFIFIGSAARADNSIITPAISHSFHESFNSAAEVKWTRVNDLYKADFYFKHQFLSSYYTEEGELVATTQNISSTELPASLQNGLHSSLDHYWISCLSLMTNKFGTCFYVVLENGDEQVIMQSVRNKKWTQYKKINKS